MSSEPPVHVVFCDPGCQLHLLSWSRSSAREPGHAVEEIRANKKHRLSWSLMCSLLAWFCNFFVHSTLALWDIPVDWMNATLTAETRTAIPYYVSPIFIVYCPVHMRECSYTNSGEHNIAISSSPSQADESQCQKPISGFPRGVLYTKRLQETLQQERKAAMASMNLSLAHCSAMLGRWATCKRSLQYAQDTQCGVLKGCLYIEIPKFG